ncbi:MAG: hypothetical protein QME12_00630 [Nanoarchaeota archaeon]|nr:hypothetical protein [Nanoarchaeota archaeon]
MNERSEREYKERLNELEERLKEEYGIGPLSGLLPGRRYSIYEERLEEETERLRKEYDNGEGHVGW